MKRGSNKFKIRALRCDGNKHAGRITGCAQGVTPRSMSTELEKIESPARHKKICNKRLPVIYFPACVTFPHISFIMRATKWRRPPG